MAIKVMFTGSQQAVVSYQGRVEVLDLEPSKGLFKLLTRMARNGAVEPVKTVRPLNTNVRDSSVQNQVLVAVQEYGDWLDSTEVEALVPRDWTRGSVAATLSALYAKGKLERRTHPHSTRVFQHRAKKDPQP